MITELLFSINDKDSNLDTVMLGFMKTDADVGSFLTLLISAALFFGVYGVYLLICKEEMIVEIWNMVVGKLVKKK